jgi:integrase
MGRFSKEQYKSGQHALTEKQVKDLLLSFNNLQDKAMIALAISIGLRREDLVNVKRNDYV